MVFSGTILYPTYDLFLNRTNVSAFGLIWVPLLLKKGKQSVSDEQTNTGLVGVVVSDDTLQLHIIIHTLSLLSIYCLTISSIYQPLYLFYLSISILFYLSVSLFLLFLYLPISQCIWPSVCDKLIYSSSRVYKHYCWIMTQFVLFKLSFF